MIILETRGFEEAEALFAEWERLLQSPELWDAAILAVAKEFKRYAESISPVVTGAYQRAHVIIPVQGGMAVTIDKGAINPVSGARVIEYAGPVEDEHHVYQRTFDHVTGKAGIDAIMERLG